MIHVGVSKQEKCIKLEKCSYNQGYIAPDILNECPEGECCVADALEELSTKLDVERICAVSNHDFEAKKCSSKCEPSTDPGR